MPRPKFEKVLLFTSLKGHFLVGAANNDKDSAHEEDLDDEPINSGH